ncbi:hypothetical protein OPT61_g4627 [Boeremia exigua]|uniref:Uncharacterized protein n=1 Tax=Boeremia exigua TaxID=749465 RepID=A0ACC2IDB8_9PLEO|nr:hypothetical protein OPT61_g4627 [Boeremia exigua]
MNETFWAVLHLHYNLETFLRFETLAIESSRNLLHSSMLAEQKAVEPTAPARNPESISFFVCGSNTMQLSLNQQLDLQGNPSEVGADKASDEANALLSFSHSWRSALPSRHPLRTLIRQQDTGMVVQVNSPAHFYVAAVEDKLRYTTSTPPPPQTREQCLELPLAAACLCALENTASLRSSGRAGSTSEDWGIVEIVRRGVYDTQHLATGAVSSQPLAQTHARRIAPPVNTTSSASRSLDFAENYQSKRMRGCRVGNRGEGSGNSKKAAAHSDGMGAPSVDDSDLPLLRPRAFKSTDSAACAYTKKYTGCTRLEIYTSALYEQTGWVATHRTPTEPRPNPKPAQDMEIGCCPEHQIIFHDKHQPDHNGSRL